MLPPALATWIAAEAGLRLPLPVVVVAAGSVALIGALGLVAQPGRRVRVAVPVLACAVAGLLCSGLRAEVRRHGVVADLARDRAAVSMRLVVTGDPQQRPGRPAGSGRRSDLILVAARAQEVTAQGRTVGVRVPVLVLAQDRTWGSLSPSQRLITDGRLSPARAGDAVSAVLSARGPPREVAGASRVQHVAGWLRSGLRTASDGLPPAERGLLPGLVDGDVSRLPAELSDDFRTTGLTHLVAVSGSNVAIILAAALFLARRSRLGPRLAPVAAALALMGFVVVARPQPSVLRAAVMGGVAVIALATGRQRSALSALFAAVIVLVLVDPDLANAAGFALSVLATLGLLVLAPGWRDRLATRLPIWLAEAVAVPAAAQLACGPVIAALSGSVSLVAVPANLLAVPAVAPATLLGVLTAMTAPMSMPLARLFARLAFVPVWWLVTVAQIGAVVPGGSLGWPDGVTGALLLALASGCLLVVVTIRALRRLAAAVLAGVVVAVGALYVVAPGWPPPGWRMVACDVGQGDALVLAAGGDAAVVVDAGPDPRLVDSCLRALGVRQVPLVLLTHLHADHVEGLPGVLRHRVVGAVETGPLDEPVEELDRVRRWSQDSGVPIRRTVVGSAETVGEVQWQVLGPTRPFVGTDSDPNNSSVVVRVSTGPFSALFTGDVEPPAQRSLLDAGVDLRADVLKVPHHGSGSQDPQFLAAVGAAVALTSVGAGNTYGHPSTATLQGLAADGMRSYRTDVDGAVAISAGPAGVRAVARRGVGTPPTGTSMRPGPSRPGGGPVVLGADSGAMPAAAGLVTSPRLPRAAAGRPAHRPPPVHGARSSHLGPRSKSPARGPPAGPPAARDRRATMAAMPVSPSPPLLTLVVGPEEFLVSQAVTTVAAAVRALDADATVRDVTVAALTPADFAELINPSLFGERRMVVLRGVEDADKMTAAAVEAYLGDMVAEVSVVAVHAGGAKGRKLLDALSAAASQRIECQNLRSAAARREFVTAEVVRAGGRIEPAAADALLQAVGNDLRALATACAQLVSDVGEVIDEAAIGQYHRGRPETTGFAVADRVMIGDAAGALELFRWGQSANVAPVLFTSALAAALRSVVQVAPYLRERPYELARRLGLPSWRVDKAQRQARGWHPEAIADAVLAVARADGEVKGGSADPSYAVERMLLDVVAARATR